MVDIVHQAAKCRATKFAVWHKRLLPKGQDQTVQLQFKAHTGGIWTVVA